MIRLFNLFSIFLYLYMIIFYLLNYQEGRISQTIFIFLLLLLQIIKHKFSWFLLLIISIILFLSFFFQCYKYYYLEISLIDYVCSEKLFSPWNPIVKWQNFYISYTFYEVFYFFYLLIGIILMNFKGYKKLYNVNL